MGFFRGSLTQEAYDREYNNRELLNRIALYFRAWLGRLIWISVLVTLMSLFGVALPIVISAGIETLTQSQENSTAITTGLVAIVLALGVLTWAVNWVRRVQTGKLIADVILSMRKDAFTAVMNH